MLINNWLALHARLTAGIVIFGVLEYTSYAYTFCCAVKPDLFFVSRDLENAFKFLKECITMRI